MKFVILFTRKEQNQRILYRKLAFKQMPEKVSLAQKTYMINYELPIFIDKKLNRLYVIDIESGCQINVSETQNQTSITPKDLDTFISGNFIREFVKSANEDFRTKVIWFVLGAIIGFLAGALIIQMIMQDKMNTLLSEQNTEVITMCINYFRGFL